MAEARPATGRQLGDSQTPDVFPYRLLARWLAAYATYGVPLAAAPISFALLALSVTGDATDGAAMVLIGVVSQIVGAVPIARVGRRLNPSVYLKSLVLARAGGFTLLIVLATTGFSFPVLVVAAGLAAVVDGASYAYLRVVLSCLVDEHHFPRALGLSSTVNEFTFVSAPVLAALLGVISPVTAVAVPAALGTLPLLLVPAVTSMPATATVRGTERRREARDGLVTAKVALWLTCAVVTAAAAAAIELAAVELALTFGLQPGWGAIFPVALCCASVAGGVWVSVRNRMPSPRLVLMFLVTSAIGSAFVAFGQSVVVAVAGAALVGAVLAPMGTFFSLVLDTLVSPDRRAEAFALLRVARSIGMIIPAALLAFGSLHATQLVSVALGVSAVALVACANKGEASRLGPPRVPTPLVRRRRDGLPKTRRHADPRADRDEQPSIHLGDSRV